jgi:hypothetical protein
MLADDSTLADCGVTEGSSLQVIRRFADDRIDNGESFYVFIQIPGCHVFFSEEPIIRAFQVHATETIDSVKRKFGDTCSRLVRRLVRRLDFGPTTLQDGRTLADYSIGRGLP